MSAANLRPYDVPRNLDQDAWFLYQTTSTAYYELCARLCEESEIRTDGHLLFCCEIDDLVPITGECRLDDQRFGADRAPVGKARRDVGIADALDEAVEVRRQLAELGGHGRQAAGDEVAGAPADADSSDPLTASVVSFQPSMRIIPSGNSTGIKLLTAQTAEGVPVAHELSEVLLSRMVTLSDNTPSFIADFDGDSELSDGDVDEFQRVWAEGDPKADLNGDGAIDAIVIRTSGSHWLARLTPPNLRRSDIIPPCWPRRTRLPAFESQ